MHRLPTGWGVPQSLERRLGWGRGTVAIIFTIPIVALVGYLTVNRVDLPVDQQELGGAGALATVPPRLAWAGLGPDRAET